MDRQDGLRRRRDRGRYGLRIEVEAGRIDIDEHRLRAQAGHGRRRRKEGVTGDDHFIAWSDVIGHQCQQQSVAPQSAADGMWHLAVFGQ